MTKTVGGGSGLLHRTWVAIVIVAVVSSAAQALDQGAPGASPPGSGAPAGNRLHSDVALLDQALRLRVVRGELSAADADAELKRRAPELAARQSDVDADPGLLAEHRREAAAFFAHVETSIRSASQWPSDQPPEKYETKAISQLESAREDYAEALREDKDPRDALRLGEQVLAWTRGEKGVAADRDVFTGEDDRVSAALQAGGGAAPTPVPPAVVAAADPTPAGGGGWQTLVRVASPAVTPPPLSPVPPAASPAPPPSSAAPPAASAAPSGAAANADENSPTYAPKQEAIDHVGNAQVADDKGDLDTAVKEYQEALKIEPRYAAWWSNLGAMLGEHGRWQDAEAPSKRAVELNPKEPEYLANLALVELRLGRRDDAVAHGKAARALAREQNNAMHASHPVYAELQLPDDGPMPTEVAAPTPPPVAVGEAGGAAGKPQSYWGIKFSVAGMKRVKEHEGTKAEAGKEIVVVTTVIDRSGFDTDKHENTCRLGRAKLSDAADETYPSSEQQRQVTAMLRGEGGGVVGDPEVRHEWSFEVPEGTKVKSFRIEFANEHVFTGGTDPDENVTGLSFDLK